eukprot:3572417-Alexandrium_andersonii.AAC.1
MDMEQSWNNHGTYHGTFMEQFHTALLIACNVVVSCFPIVWESFRESFTGARAPQTHMRADCVSRLSQHSVAQCQSGGFT